MPTRIGIAPDSWGVWFPDDPRQTPWQRFLDEVVEAGYDAIELGPYGYLPTDPTQLRRALDERGLRLAGAFIFDDLVREGAWESIRPDVESVTALLEAFDSQTLVVINTLYTDLFTGAMVGPATLDASAWSRLISTLSAITDHVASRGITAAFHPHAQTPVEHTDQVEQLLIDAPPQLTLCLDLGHIAYCGGDPVDLLQRHADRISHLHIKNVDGPLRDRVIAERLSFAEAVRLGTFCELDQGVIDYERVRDILADVDFDGWAIVEQDMYPCEFDEPLTPAARNRAYLREIGLGA